MLREFTKYNLSRQDQLKYRIFVNTFNVLWMYLLYNKFHPQQFFPPFPLSLIVFKLSGEIETNEKDTLDVKLNLRTTRQLCSKKKKNRTR